MKGMQLLQKEGLPFYHLRVASAGHYLEPLWSVDSSLISPIFLSISSFSSSKTSHCRKFERASITPKPQRSKHLAFKFIMVSCSTRKRSIKWWKTLLSTLFSSCLLSHHLPRHALLNTEACNFLVAIHETIWKLFNLQAFSSLAGRLSLSFLRDFLCTCVTSSTPLLQLDCSHPIEWPRRPVSTIQDHSISNSKRCVLLESHQVYDQTRMIALADQQFAEILGIKATILLSFYNIEKQCKDYFILAR